MLAHPWQGRKHQNYLFLSILERQGKVSHPSMSSCASKGGGKHPNGIHYNFYLWKESPLSLPLQLMPPDLKMNPVQMQPGGFSNYCFCTGSWWVSPYTVLLKEDSLGPLDISPVGYLSQAFWGAPLVRNPRLGVSEKCQNDEIPPSCVFCCSRGGYFTKTMSLPLLPISMWPFCSLLWRNSSSSFLTFFRVKWLICSCRFVASVSGCEFRIFLPRHLGLPQTPRYS